MKTLLTYLVASVAALAILPAGAETGTTRALAIVTPSETRPVDDGVEVVISLAATPPLAEGELIVLRVDDQIVVLPTGLTQFALTEVPIGTHVLEALIVDADANPVAAAESVTFRVADWLRI